MVRQKSRWLLVRLDFEDISQTTRPPSASPLHLTATDIYRALLDSIQQNYGLVAGASSELKVLLYDSEHRLAIVKTSRDHYPTVRTSLTFLTQIKQGGDAVKVAAATLSVCGSSRTARNAACAELQKTFVNSQRPLNDGESPKRRKTIEKGLNDLEQRMKHVDSCV